MLKWKTPIISNKKLHRLLRHLRPVVPYLDGYGVIHTDPRNTAFTWCLPVDGAPILALAPVAVVTTFHTCAFHGFFKPSAAEVLAQTPPRIWRDPSIVAFHTDAPPHDHYSEVTHPSGSMHRGITTFFRRTPCTQKP